MWFLTRLGMMFLILPLLAFAQSAENSSPPLLVANDNRTPAGQLKNATRDSLFSYGFPIEFGDGTR